MEQYKKTIINKILEPLFFIVIGVGIVIYLDNWVGKNTDTIQNSANEKITQIVLSNNTHIENNQQ